MATVAYVPWARRPDLVVRAGEGGRYVVKDPRSGSYFQIGEVEHFLLDHLDGRRTADDVCAAYAGRFGEELNEDELSDFLDLARAQGLLQPAAPANGDAPQSLTAVPRSAPSESPSASPVPANPWWRHLLFWRHSLFDPDRLFDWLEPHLRFVWTPGFVAGACAIVVAAAVVALANRRELAGALPGAIRWETIALAWAALFLATMCHEFAHGLTCKHYGGEVHEVGVLLLYLMPCFYCNVSDAWLLPERRKRLWVTAAGGFCDLCLWALALFAWRLTPPGDLFNRLAWVLLSVVGTRIFLNLNPLLKLDGYYLLADWVEVPNLQQIGVQRVTSYARWLLWGGPKPALHPRDRFLLGYGLASWAFGVAFLVLMSLALADFLGQSWGLVGILLTVALAAAVLRGSFHGFMGDDFGDMIRRRPKRRTAWLLGGSAACAILALGQKNDYAGGAFEVRPVVRAELRAPVAGFLDEVYADEGRALAPGARVVRLRVPNLDSQAAEKQAELREARARLKLLEVGPRPEEVMAHRHRVARTRAWRDLAVRDLARAQRVLAEDVARLDRLVGQYEAEAAFARNVLDRSARLLAEKALTAEEYRGEEKQLQVAQAQVEQARAQRRARQAAGTQDAECDLARRERELAEAEATLVLLEAGTRPEELDEARARIARLQEELAYLEGVRARLLVATPVGGLLTTARLHDKVGQYFREGELICQVEEPSALEAEIVIPDQEASRLIPGQALTLKPRALPLDTFSATLDRLAPRALHAESQASVVAYCRLDRPPAALRPGTIGYAKIDIGRRPLREILYERVMRLLRTEYW